MLNKNNKEIEGKRDHGHVLLAKHFGSKGSKDWPLFHHTRHFSAP